MNTLDTFFALKGQAELNGYVPHEKQELLHQDDHRYKVIRCGRRFGKTVFAVNKIIKEAISKGGDYWFVAPTYRQGKEIAWRQFEKYLPKELVTKKNETELSLELINGARIAIKGSDNPDSLRGVGLDGVVMDEYAFADPYSWTVISPILQDRKGWAIFISTPNGYDHFYNLHQQELTDQDFKSFHFTSYDNPYLDPLELEKERLRMSPERFEQEYRAEFMKKTGAILKRFNRDVHMIPRQEVAPGDIVYASLDFGFAIGHPTAFELHVVRSEEVHTFDGFMEEGLSIDLIDEKMRLMSGGLIVRAVYCDSARPDLIDALRKKGWNCVEADKDVELGLAKVDEYMNINPLTNKPKWTCANHLTWIGEQIEGYVWQEIRNSEGQFKQVPVKKDDDSVDALRYFLYSYNKPTQPQRRFVGFQGEGYGRKPVYASNDLRRS